VALLNRRTFDKANPSENHLSTLLPVRKSVVSANQGIEVLAPMQNARQQLYSWILLMLYTTAIPETSSKEK
jgi:hypothetical protein